MSISKIVSSIAQSKTGQRFCSYIADPKHEKFVNSTLPVCQQFLAEVTGVSIVAFNSKIEPEQKKSQLINHGLKAGLNLSVVGAASKGTASFAQKVAENLDVKGVSKGIQNGVKIGFPLITACLLSRYLIPVLLNPISSGLRDKLNEKILNKDKDSNKERGAYTDLLLKNKEISEKQSILVKKKLDIKA